MRILYGVVGEGMGHATRSQVILRHLVDKHEVQVVVSGRAHAFLQRSFPKLKIHEIAGLNMVYEDNVVKLGRTALDFVRKLPAFADNYETFSRMSEDFRPELVISDFETFAYLYAKQHDLPVLSIDNMQVMNRCDLDVKIPKGEKGNFRLAKAFVKAKLPHCDHYFITTFFFPDVRKKRTSLYPPILRDAILDAKSTVGEHVLVYQTSDSFSDLLPLLERSGEKFVVYGLNRDEDRGKVQLRNFSEAGFVADLASARAVLTGGGFSLMGEAIYLKKPIFSIPLGRQFEQTLNALYLEKLGYGEYHTEFTDTAIAKFLARVPSYVARLGEFRHDRNTSLFADLDSTIEKIRLDGRLVSR